MVMRLVLVLFNLVCTSQLKRCLSSCSRCHLMVVVGGSSKANVDVRVRGVLIRGLQRLRPSNHVLCSTTLACVCACVCVHMLNVFLPSSLWLCGKWQCAMQNIKDGVIVVDLKLRALCEGVEEVLTKVQLS